MECEKCPFAARLELVERLVQEESNKNSGFRKEVYSRLGVLEQTSVKIETQYQNIVNLIQDQKIETAKQLEKISEDIEELKQHPAKRWETASVTVLTSVIGAVIGYLASKLGG